MKYLIILFSAFLLVACKKDKETVSASLLLILQNCERFCSNASFIGRHSVGTIPFPKEIKECSCYFAKSKADFESEKYIYADDAGKTAYMKLDGKRLAMNLISSSDMEVDEELTKEIENDDYKFL
jgi:hypothetical protein